MKEKLKKLIILLSCIFIFMPFTIAYADTIEEQLNNLVGPKKQYNTMLSPVYLRNNYTEEYINPRSGELTISQTDYVLPGRNGLDVEIKRIYKSGVSNVKEMKVKYVNGAWVDYVHSDAKTSSFYEDRYNIGIGTRFSFPQMEVRKSEDSSEHIFIHTEGGDTYRLLRPVIMDGIKTYKLEGQTTKEVFVRESDQFSNGQVDGKSKYVMIKKDGKKTYFAADGRLLGIVDRYGNTIKFEYTTLNYSIYSTNITKKLMSKITDTVGRVITIEYKEDHSYRVAKKTNTKYSKDESYKTSNDPDTQNSGDLKGKYQVIIKLPDNKQIVYDKSAALVSDSKAVIRTRLQRVYDTDGKPKYHFWYEQPALGFTYTNGSSYSVYNRYENLTQIDNFRTNKISRYTYNTYTQRLNKGSMQYRKIFSKSELIKKDYDIAKDKFIDRFITEDKNHINYTYVNEADGYGVKEYKPYDENYLKGYKYYTNTTDKSGNKVKYTYDGLHQLINSLNTGTNHKEVITTEHDEMKLIKKKERVIYDVQYGKETGKFVKKIENYRYDEFGNLINYTGYDANRDDKGYPIDDERTVIYNYAYDKYHILTSKTWKKDKDTTCQINYDVDNLGNVIKETKYNTDDKNKWIVTNYNYDSFGNIIKEELTDGLGSFITNYEYGIDANGINHKGAYLTRIYKTVDTQLQEKKYAYDFNTGIKTSEIDENGNKKSYEYDDLYRLKKTMHPDETTEEYTYIDSGYNNLKINYKDQGEALYLFEYDILGYLLNLSYNDNNQWVRLESYEYDCNSNKMKEVDSNGHSTRYKYNSSYKLVEKSYYENDTILKGTMRLSYKTAVDEDTALLAEITDEEGYIKRFYYNKDNKLLKTEISPDNITFYTSKKYYDYVGNKVRDIDYRGKETNYIYDDIGRLTKIIDPLNNETEYIYNSINNVSKIKEPNKKTTDKIYDQAGRLIEERRYLIGEENYTYTSYSYDKAGNMASEERGTCKNGVKQASSKIELVYNNMNRVVDEYIWLEDDKKTHTTYSYDLLGNMTQKTTYTDKDEHKCIQNDYVYTKNGQLIEEETVYKVGNIEDQEMGKVLIKYQKDYQGNLLKQEILNNNTFETYTYQYDNRNNIIKKIEPFKGEVKKITEITYDKRNNPLVSTQIINGAKCTNSFTYDGLNRLTAQTDALGNTTRYLYDKCNNLIKEVDARYSNMSIESAPGRKFEYDMDNRRTKVISYNGYKDSIIEYNLYDGRGNLLLQADELGYNSESPELSIGNKYEYDADNRVVKFTSADVVYQGIIEGVDRHSIKYEYNGDGQVISQEDAYGNKVETTYYGNGNVKSVKYPNGYTENFRYDNIGKFYMQKKTSDGLEITTYNNIYGKPIRVVYPDETEAHYGYTNKGEITKSIDQEGNEALFEYDEASNVISKKEYIKEDESYKYYRLTKTSYNETNSPLSTETFSLKEAKVPTLSNIEEPIGNKNYYEYDKANNLIKVTGANGEETIREYDANNNLITEKRKISEGEYNVNRYEYDHLLNLAVSSVLVKTSDVDIKSLTNPVYDNEYSDKILASTKYSYYTNGKVKTMEDSRGNITKYEYNHDGKIKKLISPKGYTVKYKYDLRGNVKEQTDARGNKVQYEYDEMNKLTHKKQPYKDSEQSITRYVYDKRGNIKKQINPEQYEENVDIDTMLGTSYVYDNMNRVIEKISPEGETLSYIQYTKKGNPKKVVDGIRYQSNIEDSKGTSYDYDGLGRVIKVTNPLGDSKAYKYNLLDNIIEETNEKGLVTKFEYDTVGNLTKIEFSDGSKVKYEYDLANRKIKEEDQLANVTSFEYNGFNKKRKDIDTYLNTQEYKYDLAGNLTVLEDKRGNKTEFKYDENNKILEKRQPAYEDGSGNIVYILSSYTYDENGNLTKESISDTKGLASKRETMYQYYENNKLKMKRHSNGSFQKLYYDKNGNIVKKETSRDSENNDIEKFEYDLQNRLIKSIKLIDKTSIAEDEELINGLIDLEYQDKLQVITGYEYDILGNKTREIRPKAYQLGLDSIKAKDYITDFNYDIFNRLTEITRSYEQVEYTIKYSYDKLGNKISEVNEKGSRATFDYDSLNRIKTVTDAKGFAFTYTYDEAGNKLTETNAKGDTITYSYDKLGRVKTIKDPYSKVITENVYDENGNLIERKDAKGYKTSYKYDMANRQIEATDPNSADEGKVTLKIKYNIFGEKISEEDALGNITEYEYDSIGRLIGVTDALGIKTSYSYDRAGNKLTQTNGKGKTRKYSYSSFGILKSLEDAEGKIVTYTYDITGNTAQVIDKVGNNTKYQYNSQGQLIEKKVLETGDSVQYEYDVLGNKIKMIDETGETTYSYDVLSRLESITKDGQGYIAYSYDEVGNIEEITDKLGNRACYTYDKSNRMKTVTSGSSRAEYEYDENGNRSRVTYVGNITEEYSYDKNNNLIDLTNKVGSTEISHYSYTYDLAGRQTSKTDSFGTTSYSYDKAGRIKEVKAPGKTTSYSYDKAGNRRSQREEYTSEQPSGYKLIKTGEDVTYVVKESQYVYSSSDKLLKLVEKMYNKEGEEILKKSVEYIYDANGNEIRQKADYIHPHDMTMIQSTKGNTHGKGITEEISTLIEREEKYYDGFNRLVKVDKITSGIRNIVTYRYNGDGQRTTKQEQSSKDGYVTKTTNYYYDRQHVILETGTETVSYVRGINYISRKSSIGLSYYFYNGHGDVVQTVSENGEVRNQYDYDIFGNPLLTIEEEKNEIRYSGEYYDESTGLYYLRARYYNPYTGRFISEDSYWGEDSNPLSLNLYVYCYNDPVRFVDPTGHWGGKAGEYDDRKLSRSEQKKIKRLTDAYFSTKDDEERKRIHEKANKIREEAKLKADWSRVRRRERRRKSTNHKERFNTDHDSSSDSFSNAAERYLDDNKYFTDTTWQTLSEHHNRRGYGYRVIKRNENDTTQETVDAVVNEIDANIERSDYLLGTKDYNEDIEILHKEILDDSKDRDFAYKITIEHMDEDKYKYSQELQYSLKNRKSFNSHYTKIVDTWDEEILQKLGIDDTFSKDFKHKMINHYKETGKGIEEFFSQIQSPEEQDANILSSRDLMSVRSLKATYAVYAQQNDGASRDKMYAILRAIDIIRSKKEYRGKYDLQNEYGDYISMYCYHNKKIWSKIHIADGDPARDSAIVNTGTTLLSLAPPPYSIVGYALSVGVHDEFTSSTAVDGGLTMAGLMNGIEGMFFTGIGFVKSGFGAYREYQDLKGFTNMYVTVQQSSIFETHSFQFNPDKFLVKVGQIDRVDFPIPAEFSSYDKNYPTPDIKLVSGEKYWFNQ
ncbi:RHS repeat-associated core domain-containing protein [Abyssisolibacter fermentans]|uniref:RHS repeat-associated core domain-containing protein n=1 Tax=Abyssisolibacter fermentans TaxID=1766203 RepID=UPI000835A23D|nr:RHS repeat-associated core domain-containing protein [Abyssisolibacter fermentans]